MLTIDEIKYFINTRFCDKVIDVLPPRECWTEYDNQRVLLSYIVTIKHKYAGDIEEVFFVEYEEDIDENPFRYSETEKQHFREISRKQALKSALAFYNQMRQQITPTTNRINQKVRYENIK